MTTQIPTLIRLPEERNADRQLDTARRLAQRHVRKRRNPASDASRSGGHVESTFGDPLAAARRVDLAGKPVAKARSKEFAPGPLSRMRSDPGHDVEVNLQRLLQDWQRAAA